MAGKMTTRSQNVLNFIRTFRARYGYSPSRREIGKACKIASLSNVNGVLTQLVEKGEIELAPRVQRGIVLLEPTSEGDWVVLNQLARQPE